MSQKTTNKNDSLGVKSGKKSKLIMGLIKASIPAFASILSVFGALAYFIHFKFSSGMLRLVYMGFLCFYPIVSLVFNCVVGNSMRRIVLQEQDKLPHNAEYVDFEDTETDIMRKATIKTVQKRIYL